MPCSANAQQGRKNGLERCRYDSGFWGKHVKLILRGFSHPDYTVGFGIAPNQPTWEVGSWTLPPVRIFTSPRNSGYIIMRHFIFVNYLVISFIYRLKKVTPFLSCAIGILSFVEWVVSISDASTVNGAKRYKLSVISS